MNALDHQSIAAHGITLRPDVGSEMPTINIADQGLAAMFAALGHPTRLGLWRALVPCGNTGLSVGTLCSHMSIVPSSLSFHLKLMREAGLLVQRRSSRHIIYAVPADLPTSLASFFTTAAEVAAPGSEQPDHVAGDRQGQPDAALCEIGHTVAG